MTAPRAFISDFGGVLTTPLLDAFATFQRDSGVSLEALGAAMGAIAREDGEHPLFELERGHMTEREFLDRLARALSARLGREVELHAFGERLFEGLEPNEPMFAYCRELRDRGLRMAILTNNVREWEPLWRRMLPIDEVFELVVDSAFVGMRKPEPAIYELTLERLGLPASACVFLDDFEHNVRAARELGLRAVHFRDTEQAIADVEAVLAGEAAAAEGAAADGAGGGAADGAGGAATDGAGGAAP